MDVLCRAVRFRKAKHAEALAKTISVRQLSINAKSLLPYYFTLPPRTRKVLLDRIGTQAVLNISKLIKDTELAHELRRQMDARRAMIFESDIGALGTAPWLTENDAIRVSEEKLPALLKARPDLKRATMIAALCGDPCDQSGRVAIIAQSENGSDALSERSFSRQLFTKNPDQELIRRFKTHHQESTFEVLFEVLPWLSKDPRLISKAAERPGWQSLFKIMLPRGFSLYSPKWSKRPLVIAWARRVTVQPKETRVALDTGTLEWLARFSSTDHVIRAIQSGHRVNVSFKKDGLSSDAVALLRAAKWPMKWTESTHRLMPIEFRRTIFFFMLCAQRLRRLPPEMLRLIFSNVVDNRGTLGLIAD